MALKQNKIGLKRGTVKLMPYDPKWPDLFNKEKALLQKTFGDQILAIEHIGSTAIPGISAKPIIDIEIGVESLDVARDMKEKFEKIGYEHRPFVPGYTKEEMQWEELYAKGPEEKRTYYVHVTIYDDSHWKNDLFFRDYLRQNLSVAKDYTELKQKLAKKYTNDRRSYTDGKDSFIKNILEMAKKK